MITKTMNSSGTLVILGLVMLLQFSAVSTEFDLKTHQDPQLFDSPKCLFGPSYWCKSMSNAVSCKAVKHCIQTTWETQKHPIDVDGPVLCYICQQQINLILQLVKNNCPQDQLIEKLVLVCNKLLIPSKISLCKSGIRTVMPIIINSTSVVVNPKSICFALHMCPLPFVNEHTLKNENEVTVNIEKENTDDQTKREFIESSPVLNFEPEKQSSSFIDVVYRKMHDTDAADVSIILLDDQTKQKSEEPLKMN